MSDSKRSERAIGKFSYVCGQCIHALSSGQLVVCTDKGLALLLKL